MSSKRSIFSFSSPLDPRSRRVIVLRYTFNNNDFLMKRNELRSEHLAHLRKYSMWKGANVEFKVAESLDIKSLYWHLGTTRDEIEQFVREDPWFQNGVIKSWNIFQATID